MAFSVLYDANALFGALQRSILVRVGIYQTKLNLRVLLTDRMLDEMVCAVKRTYVDFTDNSVLDSLLPCMRRPRRVLTHWVAVLAFVSRCVRLRAPMLRVVVRRRLFRCCIHGAYIIQST